MAAILKKQDGRHIGLGANKNIVFLKDVRKVGRWRTDRK